MLLGAFNVAGIGSTSTAMLESGQDKLGGNEVMRMPMNSSTKKRVNREPVMVKRVGAGCSNTGIARVTLNF